MWTAVRRLALCLALLSGGPPLAGCDKSPAVAEQVGVSAVTLSYNAALEDQELGTYDRMLLQISAPASHAGRTIAITLSPGDVPVSSPVRTAGTQLRFTLRRDQLGKQDVPFAALGEFREAR
jgi:hypothetical protein